MLFWNLHVSPRAPNAQSRTRGDKVKNVVDYLRERFFMFFVPLFESSIDESTIAFKGRVVFKCYNKDKPIKWGLKVFVLSDSRSGYILDFEPYYGQTTTDNLIHPDLPFTARIVIHLAKKLSTNYPGSGFHIFTDRYYTGMELACKLKKQKIHLTGTVQANRKNLPLQVKKGALNLKKHEVKAYRHKDDILCSAWKDKRNVLMLSTLCNNGTETIERREKNRREATKISKPSVICEYNRFMGGVDNLDHYVASYKFTRKSLKWWRKLFFWLLEVSVVNSFLLYNMNQLNKGLKYLNHRKFREALIMQLVGDVRNSPVNLKRGRRSTADNEERLDGRQHFVSSHPNSKSKDCAVCSDRKVRGGRKETVFFCKTCTKKPGLHPTTCFERYHTMKKFKLTHPNANVN